MNATNNQVNEVKQTIDDLIQTATTYDVDALERIYHDDMKVIMVDPQDQVHHLDKVSFKSMFAAKRDAGDPPMNTWVKYHHIEQKDASANVVLSRRNNLNGQDMSLFLSIDLCFEDGRWQVLREVISLRPL